MNKYPSVLIITTFAMCCIITGILIVYFGEKHDKSFSSPSSSVPVPATQAGPGRIILSTVDLQRELNSRYPKLKLKEDGVYGPLTQAAHERAIGDQYAKELMVWEVK